MTLSIDENFDSKIDMEEAYSTDKNVSIEDILLSHVNSISIEDIARSKASETSEDDSLQADFSVAFNDILSIAVTLLLNSQKEKVKELLEKLKDNNGDASKLDAVENQIIQDVLKIQPIDGKYKIEDIDKILNILEKYELNDDSSNNEDSLESAIDKVST